MARQLEAKIRTALAVKELASVFHTETARLVTPWAKLGSFVRGMTILGKNRLEYFTPEDRSPFNALDDDKPDFAVGAVVPKTTATGGGQNTVYMYVWDRGPAREVSIIAPHTIGSGPSARRVVDRLTQGIRAADPKAIVAK